MKDIAKEIIEVEKKGNLKEKMLYFYEETKISKEYLKKIITDKYPNLIFIKILIKKIEKEYSFHDTIITETYYFFPAFINIDLLEFISTEFMIKELNNDKIVDLTNYNYNQQIQIRNKILKSCPIIVAQNEFYYHSEETIGRINIKSDQNISIYPNDYEITNYELLNFTRFILISNSKKINQNELDNLCLDILRRLSQDNGEIINSEKQIYLNINRKIKTKKPLNKEEVAIIEKFINNEINKIEKSNTILIRSKERNRK